MGSETPQIRMGHVLLLDPDAQHRDTVKSLFRSHFGSLVACSTASTVADALELLRQHQFDILILSALSNENWHVCMDAVRTALGQSSNPPKILCVLRGPYRGPAAEVYGARRGFRVIYER